MPGTLGTRIKRARERKRMRQKDLAAALGVSIKTVDNWENDRTRPASSIGALEHVLGVSLDEDIPPLPPVPPELADYPELVEDIRQFAPDPDDQARVMAWLAAVKRGAPPPTSPGEEGPSGETRAG